MTIAVVWYSRVYIVCVFYQKGQIMIKAAVVGVTGFGATHFNDLMREHEAGRVQPVAAVIINPEDAGDKVERLKAVGCDILPDFDTLIAKYAGKLDICCIPTGIALHKSMSVAAVEAGFNVYVEKPVAATVDEVQAMSEAVRKSGKFIAVGYQDMYQPSTFRIKEVLCSGIIGKAVQFRCYAMWPRSFAYYGRNKWAGRVVGDRGEAIIDSPFTNALAHDLNLQLFYAGNSFDTMPEIATVQAAMFRANDIESCDTASIRMTTRCGKELLMTVTHAANCLIHPLHVIQCEKGYIRTNRCEKFAEVYDADGNQIENISFDSPIRTNIWDALIDRINGGKSFICTPEIAGVHTLVANAVFDSAPVEVVPPELVSTVTFDETGVRRRVVTGIEAAIRRSFDEKRMLNAGDFPFIRQGEVVDMNSYRSFGNIMGFGK